MTNTDARLRIVSIFLTLIGLVDAVYLTYIKLAHKEAACAGIGDCDAVNSSRYAEVAGIPIALLGAVAYLMILFFLIFDRQKNVLGENSILFVLGLSFIGVLYSAYLTYLELFVLHAVCPFCVISAIVLVLLFALTLVRYLKEPQDFENIEGGE
ncbi:MAG: vitamin K epoxide reductase family protein [Anaerolineales bacterium]|nr:vitamin K epoxide reductase family protein [Anaerolineales bacterium]